MPHSIEYKVFRRGLIYTLSFIAFLWLILLIERAGGYNFSKFGVYPRTLSGTIGILTGPLVHGGIFHLFTNTLPLLILGLGLFYFYHRIALEVFVWIYISTGFWVWIIGRNAYHIGASGIVYGMMSFIIVSGLMRKDIRSLATSLAVFFLYSGTLYGLFPVEPNISWESHLMGLLSGVALAVYFRKEPIFVGDNEDGNPDEDENHEEKPYFTDADSSSENEVQIHYIYRPGNSPGKSTEKNKS